MMSRQDEFLRFGGRHWFQGLEPSPWPQRIAIGTTIALLAAAFIIGYWR